MQLFYQYDPSGNITTYSYDALGNISSVTNPLGNTDKFKYDF
ncbi:MAG: RHS repeat protein, partial [Clostridia bacterium]|nr:RHS repeat protein [Clostridia bacterium]